MTEQDVLDAQMEAEDDLYGPDEGPENCCEACGVASDDIVPCPTCGWQNCWRCRETMDDLFLGVCKGCF